MIPITVRAKLLTEQGRPNTLIIPPRTTREVPTDVKNAMNGVRVIGILDDIKRSLFVVNPPAPSHFFAGGSVYLYNGGHETIWLRHEDHIADLVLEPKK